MKDVELRLNKSTHNNYKKGCFHHLYYIFHYSSIFSTIAELTAIYESCLSVAYDKIFPMSALSILASVEVELLFNRERCCLVYLHVLS